MSDIFNRYIFFQHPPDADSLSVWNLGTHCFDAFDIYPRVGVTAREPISGKSTVLKVILRLARSPFPNVCPTAAVIYRAIEAYHAPTMVIDEGDNTFYSKTKEDLMAIVNSGQEKDLAFVARNVSVGDGYELRKFSTWAPMAYAMIGRPKETLLSRSIEISMHKSTALDPREDLPRLRHTPPIFTELRRKCARWAADNIKKVAGVKVEKVLMNRAADNWEPLMQMSILAGGAWPERIVNASKSYGDETAVKSNPHVLLRDIRDIFFTRNVDQIPVTTLVADLVAQIESPWSRCDRGDPLTPNILGHMLADDKITSKPRKQPKLPGMEERASVRVYDRRDFNDLIKSYLVGEEPRLVPISSL